MKGNVPFSETVEGYKIICREELGCLLQLCEGLPQHSSKANPKG